MATGRLGNTAPSASTNTLVYTVPANNYSVFNVSFTNTNASAVTVRLAISNSSSAPTTQEFIEYGTTIIGNGVFERTGLVAANSTNVSPYVWVWVSNTGVNVTVYGIETSTS